MPTLRGVEDLTPLATYHQSLLIAPSRKSSKKYAEPSEWTWFVTVSLGLRQLPQLSSNEPGAGDGGRAVK